ncbi:carbamoyltransferase HypF [Shewanella colwelliana]|uniref:carbamoyltransferase HypF n=1 Tax=Shewanella colwelliana TaxID=23 RepID=UPI00299EE146|nr:carbamoyltransferase HypF [Shewanella colwelliana]MDX1280345.1 carbamoyltransferase HypF [Shewanella colwelliana]
MVRSAATTQPSRSQAKPLTDPCRIKLVITGIVQGVGFRPFVYRLATELNLSGFTFNNSQGVTIELQGNSTNITQFVDTLTHTPPPLARIDTFEQVEVDSLANCSGFEIIHSESDCSAQVAISADKSSCPDCLSELNDPTNRHYRYPFTNCTNCGPRYTLINALPYDRPNTSMAHFTMCPECERAYQDPLDRRYHAQPVSCPHCGPQLTLTDNQGAAIAHKDAALQQTVERIKAGEIVAIKGLGGFHLVCDATNHAAVTALRLRKQRPAKPFAVMCADIETAKSLARGSDLAWQVLTSQERPIVLLDKYQTPTGETQLSPSVAPTIDRIGLFLPYTPLHHILLQALKRPLVATSANRSGEPIITDSQDICARLQGVVDCILDHDRIILNGCDDSVVQVIDDTVQIIRLARGYAPLTMHCNRPVPQSTLAVGAQQKNSIAFGFGHNLVLSPHIGDLFSLEAEQYFIDTLATFKRLYAFNPEQIIRDCHPDYASSQWAEQFSQLNGHSQPTQVQHHYAHILSVMAANQHTGKVLGFSFDGTGLGEGRELWGGEAMIADIQGYQRIAHLKPITLIGAEQAIKDPRRIMLAMLFEQYTLEQVLQLPLTNIAAMPQASIINLHKLWQKGVATQQTSSVGRLFDALACLLGVIETTQFEGQAGMIIESLANGLTEQQVANAGLVFNLPLIDGQWQTDQLWQQMMDVQLSRGDNETTKALIAKGFMDCLADAAVSLAKRHPQLPIALCGGVYQNRYLLSLTRQRLDEHGLNWLDTKGVPVNDGGIALGQLWYGIHQ